MVGSHSNHPSWELEQDAENSFYSKYKTEWTMVHFGKWYESLNSQGPPTSRHTSSSKTPPESPQTASSTGDQVFKCLRLWGTSLIQTATVESEWMWKRLSQYHIRRSERPGQLRDYCSNQAKGGVAALWWHGDTVGVVGSEMFWMKSLPEGVS